MSQYIVRMKPAPPTPKSTSDRLTTVLSYGTLLLLIYLVFRIVEPFLVPLAWSGVLAIFFYPVHKQIMRWLPSNRAALVSTLGVTLLLIAPALVVLVYTAREAIDATAQLQNALMDPQKALPSHALAWIRHERKKRNQHRPENRRRNPSYRKRQPSQRSLQHRNHQRHRHAGKNQIARLPQHLLLNLFVEWQQMACPTHDLLAIPEHEK